MKRIFSAAVFSALGFGLTIGFAVAESSVYEATKTQAAECGKLAIAIREATADPEKQVEAFNRAQQYIAALNQMRSELKGEDRAAVVARVVECKEAIGLS